MMTYRSSFDLERKRRRMSADDDEDEDDERKVTRKVTTKAEWQREQYKKRWETLRKAQIQSNLDSRTTLTSCRVGREATYDLQMSVQVRPPGPRRSTLRNNNKADMKRVVYDPAHPAHESAQGAACTVLAVIIYPPR
jgi:hypothetical protein